MTHYFEWPIFNIRADGTLVYADNNHAYPNAPRFASTAEAEAWLVANDIRGDVR
jgi:hypothetical protein